MGDTPIFHFPYPEDTTPNDLHEFFLNLATPIEEEMSRQGPLEERPAAGFQGRIYWATTHIDPYTSLSVTWNVLYRDDGVAWQQVSDSAIQTYVPVWQHVAGESPPFAISVDNTSGVAEYQVLANGKCWFNVHRLVTLTGTDSSNGISINLPLGTPTPSWFAAAAQNNPIGAIGDPVADAVNFYQLPSSNTGKFFANGVAYWFRVTGTYRVG